MRSTFHGFLLGAADAAELFHQVGLRGQPPCGVGNHDIHAAGAACGNSIKDDGGGVAAGLRDDFHAVAFAPDGKLLPGGCAEGVACCEQNAFAVIGKALGKLADGCGFAGAVDAAHHDDAGLGLVRIERAFCRSEYFFEFVAQRTADFILGLEALELNVIAEAL